jgi:hypothetical protein
MHPLFSRRPDLKGWIASCISEILSVTKPEDWFYNANADGNYEVVKQHHVWAWDLPPGAALDAVEELGLARFKRLDSLIGMVVMPFFLKPEWFRRYVKNVDLYFFITVGANAQWPTSMHEGLTIGVYFPLLGYNPWEWSKVSFMGKLGSTLSALFRTALAYFARILERPSLGCHYATKHGAQAATVRDVAETYRCIPEAIRRLLLMLLKNLDILLRQDLVILYSVLLNVMNALFFDSRVFLAELTTKITKYFLISFDVLIWMLLGRVSQELLLNLQEFSIRKSPLAVFMIFKCSPSLWVHSRLTMMGECEQPLVYCIGPTELKNMKTN